MILNRSPLFDAPAAPEATYAVLIVLLAIGVAVFGLAMVFLTIRESWSVKTATVLTPVSVVLLLSAIVSAPITHEAWEADQQTLVDEHAEEIADWLDDEYDIDVSDEAAGRLLDGETISVEYGTTATRIELVRNADDRVEVYDTGTGKVLEGLAP